MARGPVRVICSALLVLAAGCSAAPAPPPAVAAASPPTSTAAPIETGAGPAAVDAAQTSASPDVDLGVAVLDRISGDLHTGPLGEEPFLTASLAKLVVAVDVLYRHRTRDLPLTGEDEELLRRALGPSDDDAMNALWVRFDGPGAAPRVASRLGLTATKAPGDPGRWGDMTMSAGDVARLYDHVLTALPAPDRELMVAALAAAPAVAADGFDQAFGMLSPAVTEPVGTETLAKQGWMCCHSGRAHLHTAGVVGPDQRYVVVVLSRVPRSARWDAARAGSTAAALAAVRELI